MRHLRKVNKLGRTSEQRAALLKSLAIALIGNKKLVTTVAKAKALRKYVEPMVNRAKEDSTHNRRLVFSSLGHKESIAELFDQIGPKAKNRPGGYTRVLKIGTRSGDGAEMAMIELVDYNDVKPAGGAAKAKKTRRSKSRKKPDEAGSSEQAAE
jgi:large subunit ribosomal protein L17